MMEHIMSVQEGEKNGRSFLFFSFVLVFMYSCSMGAGQGRQMLEDRGMVSTEDRNGVSDRGEVQNGQGQIYDVSLPIFESQLFATSGLCARCHSNLKDTSGEDVSIDSDWRSTMMANSAKDPFWQAKAHSEVLRTPKYKSEIEKKCATCHMPMAKVQAESDGEEIKIFNGGFLTPNNKYHKLALDGVSCSICHQIQDDPSLGTEASFTGGFKIDLQTPKPDRKIFGPYREPLVAPMRNMDSFTPEYSPHIEKSEICATCHTLYTTPIDDSGNIVTDNSGNPVKFPEQTPYLEWRHSIFGDGVGNDDKSCQQCHMPQAKGGVKISNRPRRLRERQPFYKHYFVGGNAFMLSILKNNIAELGLTAEKRHFEKTIERTIYLLQNETAEIKVGNISREGDFLNIPVVVKNIAGHKVPTGYPSRRVWIHFVVRDSEGNVIFESGRAEHNGKIIGNDADEKQEGYEPHYDIIDSQDKVQIYEAIMIDYRGNITYTLMRAKDYIKDNRLLPTGFDKRYVPEDIAPKGRAKDDPNFTGGQDTVVYKVNISGKNPPFSVEVELKYQSVSYSFFRDLISDREKSEYISRFEKMYSQEDNSGYVISRDKKVYGE